MFKYFLFLFIYSFFYSLYATKLLDSLQNDVIPWTPLSSQYQKNFQNVIGPNELLNCPPPPPPQPSTIRKIIPSPPPMPPQVKKTFQSLPQSSLQSTIKQYNPDNRLGAFFLVKLRSLSMRMEETTNDSCLYNALEISPFDPDFKESAISYLEQYNDSRYGRILLFNPINKMENEIIEIIKEEQIIRLYYESFNVKDIEDLNNQFKKKGMSGIGFNLIICHQAFHCFSSKLHLLTELYGFLLYTIDLSKPTILEESLTHLILHNYNFIIDYSMPNKSHILIKKMDNYQQIEFYKSFLRSNTGDRHGFYDPASLNNQTGKECLNEALRRRFIYKGKLSLQKILQKVYKFNKNKANTLNKRALIVGNRNFFKKIKKSGILIEPDKAIVISYR